MSQLSEKQLKKIHSTFLNLISFVVFGKKFDASISEGRILEEWYNNMYKPILDMELQEEE